MADLTFDKTTLPFLLGGSGQVHVHLSAPDALQAIPQSNEKIVDVTFDASASTTPFTLGAPDTATLAISAHAASALTPVWKTSDDDHHALLAKYGIDGVLDDHTDRLAL